MIRLKKQCEFQSVKVGQIKANQLPNALQFIFGIQKQDCQVFIKYFFFQYYQNVVN
jgi:hypothetical protein